MTRASGVVLLVVGIWASPAAAQGPPVRDSLTADSLIADSRLFQRSDLHVLAAFAGATLAMFPLDERLTAEVRSQRLLESRTLNRIEQTLDFVGGPGPLLIGGTMYLVGRYGGYPRASHLAVHTTEAVIVGLATAGTLKMLLGRARPFFTADTNPRNFGFARGFRGTQYQSFPSGHSTTSFAVAAAVTSEAGAWWPGAKWMVGTVLFGGATLVGLSRMYDDKHWASDVVVGAAIGTFAGLKTVRFNHTRTGNRLDRWLLGDSSRSVNVSPGPEGSIRIGVAARW